MTKQLSVDEICSEVAAVELPEEDHPSSAEIKELRDCHSIDLYFGFGEAADPVRARKCAYKEMAENRVRRLYWGSEMLIMIYANGYGATRNFDIALKLACKKRLAPGESEGTLSACARHGECRVSSGTSTSTAWTSTATRASSSGACSSEGA